jgi:hypothetical protein
MVRIYPRKETDTTRVELLSLQASMVRSSIKRRTVRVLQLNSSAASGIDKSSFFIGHFFYFWRIKFGVGVSCIQTPGLVNIVNSEPIAIYQPDVYRSEGVAINNFP